MPKSPSVQKQQSPKAIRTRNRHKGLDWHGIEILFTTNQATLAKLSTHFGINYNTLKVRAMRGKWNNKRLEHLKLMQAIPKEELTLIPVPQGEEIEEINEEGADNGTKLEEIDLVSSQLQTKALARDIWAQRQHEHRDLAYRKAHGGVRNAKLPAPKSWKDIEIADRMARKAAGLDEDTGPKVNVSVNVGFLNGGIS